MRKRNICCFWPSTFFGIFLSLFFFRSSFSVAQNFDNLRFNGFMRSQVTASDNKALYRERINQTPNFVNHNVLGLNIATEIDPYWRVNGQFLAGGGDFHFTTTADWFFATFEPRDWFSMRFGKQSSPLWLLSDSVDIGVTYPWVNPPTEVYYITPVRTYSGVSMNFKNEIISENYLSLEVYAGGVDNVFDNPLFSEPTVVKGDNLMGAYLLWSNDWLLCRLGYLQVRANVPNFGIEKWPIEAMSAGATIDYGGWVFFSEYAKIEEKRSDARRAEDALPYQLGAGALQQKIESEMATGAQPSASDVQDFIKLQGAATLQSAQAIGHQAFYTTLGYKIKKLLPHYTYASLKAPESQLVLGGDQTSHMVGIKYSVTSQIVGKISAQKIFIKDGKIGIFNRNADGSIPEDINGTVEVKAAIDITF